MLMGEIFDQPGPATTEQEFERVLDDMKSRHSTIPHEVFERWRVTAKGYMSDRGRYRGMDAKELPEFMSAAKTVTPSLYHGALSDLEAELGKAVKGTYGNPMHI